MSEEAWEAAYLAFETPDEERRKFVRRLRDLRIEPPSRDARAVEIFCGRGNGIGALREIGFRNVAGVDLSLRLCREAPRGAVAQGDCRLLPLRSRSVDLVVVQGGLHHLPSVREDLPRVVAEVARVLRDGGSFVAVEPWNTPFLRLLDALARFPPLRSASRKVDAFITMIELEGGIYRTWLESPSLIRQELHRAFDARHDDRRFGKIFFVGDRK